jgi:paraquat-inducible protein A
MKRLAPFFLAVACLLFGAALALPVFSITPGAGDFTGWIRMIRPQDMAQIQQALLAGIRLLWTEGNPVLAMILTVFCIVFPLFKFTVLWTEVFGGSLEEGIWGKICRITAPYAMVEVFVLAILVMIVKGLPGGSDIEVQAGAWCFAGSVILSLIAAGLLKVGRVRPTTLS